MMNFAVRIGQVCDGLKNFGYVWLDFTGGLQTRAITASKAPSPRACDAKNTPTVIIFAPQKCPTHTTPYAVVVRRGGQGNLPMTSNRHDFTPMCEK